MKLETDRLIIQDIEGNNAKGMVQYVSILQITHFVSDWANLLTDNGTRNKRIMQYMPEPQAGDFVSDWGCNEVETMVYMVYSIQGIERYAICLKSSGYTIGDLFVVAEEYGTYNIGLHFNNGFNGNGYAIEAAHAFIGYLFDSAAAERIYGLVETGDMKSKRMCERLGMHSSGHIDKAVAYAIGRNDWHDKKKIKPII